MQYGIECKKSKQKAENETLHDILKYKLPIPGDDLYSIVLQKLIYAQPLASMHYRILDVWCVFEICATDLNNQMETKRRECDCLLKYPEQNSYKSSSLK